MGFRFTFTELEDIKQLKMLVDFMASQDLDYPYYDEWLQKAENQLEKKEKQAILAFSGGKLAGDLVYQVCKDKGLGNLREIKNLRIHPQVRERYFANFMLKQLYTESKDRYDGLIVDVRASQKETYNFFINCGFIPVMNASLYEKNMDEIVMFKSLKKDSELLKPKIKRIIQTRSF